MKAQRSDKQAFVGVDIAATTATVACFAHGKQTTAPFTIEQNQAGFAKVLQHLQRLKLPAEAFAIVMENTSTYWMPLALFLINAGYQVSVVNPMQTHHFAKSHLRRAKTDPLDAVLLAQYAADRPLKPWNPPAEIYYELRARLLVRQQLLEIKTQLKNHDQALRHCPVLVRGVHEPIVDFCAALDEQSLAFEQEIKALLETGNWSSNAELLRSIPGLGTITIAWLLVGTQNFTLCQTQEELVAYAGLAPMPYESGSRIRRRRSIGYAGNAYLRKALYLATLNAAQTNPIIRSSTRAWKRPVSL